MELTSKLEQLFNDGFEVAGGGTRSFGYDIDLRDRRTDESGKFIDPRTKYQIVATTQGVALIKDISVSYDEEKYEVLALGKIEDISPKLVEALKNQDDYATSIAQAFIDKLDKTRTLQSELGQNPQDERWGYSVSKTSELTENQKEILNGKHGSAISHINATMEEKAPTFQVSTPSLAFLNQLRENDNGAGNRPKP